MGVPRLEYPTSSIPRIGENSDKSEEFIVKQRNLSEDEHFLHLKDRTSSWRILFECHHCVSHENRTLSIYHISQGVE